MTLTPIDRDPNTQQVTYLVSIANTDPERVMTITSMSMDVL